MYGSNVTCIYATSVLLTSFLNSLIASKKGKDSISPTVPPVSYTHLTLPTKVYV